MGGWFGLVPVDSGWYLYMGETTKKDQVYFWEILKRLKQQRRIIAKHMSISKCSLVSVPKLHNSANTAGRSGICTCTFIVRLLGYSVIRLLAYQHTSPALLWLI